MHFTISLWLLLCYAKFTKGEPYDRYEDITNDFLFPKERTMQLPVEIGKDPTSGCICRASERKVLVVCFGNYICQKFPQIQVKSDILRVRTTSIKEILKGELDYLYHLKVLEIEGNYQLTYLESGVFRNLSNLQQLSISYNTCLRYIEERTFSGLTSLRNLTMVNNGFTNILQLTPEFKPSILPQLERLDLSENNLQKISEHAFVPMEGTSLKKLVVRLCRLDYIHPNSLLPLKVLKELKVSDNDLNSTVIINSLIKMMDAGINLTSLDLSGMGFRKQIPRDLLDVIAVTTIKILAFARNQFEIIPDDAFPTMISVEVIDLRKVQCIEIGLNTFEPEKFPNLKVLLLSGNTLPGLHERHLSDQLLYLDISCNKGSSDSPMYYEIERDTFLRSKQLKGLNLAYNRIKAIFNYSFSGLGNLKILNMENGTIFYIGNDTFKPTKSLEMLNLANNPLTASHNLTGAQFKGLNELKVLNMRNCGIKVFNDDDNIFEMMPNLTQLILRHNRLYFITAETLKPLKFLQVLDLSENLIVSWWRPLFLASGVTPHKLYLSDNKISHFSLSMIMDISFLLENNSTNSSIHIDLMNNVFVCDCNVMYKTYTWLNQNGSVAVKDYFTSSNFLCSSPERWEDRKITDYISSMKKKMQCLVYDKVSSIMLLVWTAPTLVTVVFLAIFTFLCYKYRFYVRYWIFLAKLAIGRTFIRDTAKAPYTQPVYKYDAFISYSNDDRDFILEMVNNLEEKPPHLKLCIFERDFEIGSFISECVVTCMNESRYIILVLSNSFLKSQWCRWESQMADYHRLVLDNGTNYDPLVLVKLNELDGKYLTTTLKYLLKTKIYLSWDEQRSDMFWKKLRCVLSKRN